MICEDCKGSGKYVGMRETSVCLGCGGSGEKPEKRVRRLSHIDGLEQFIRNAFPEMRPAPEGVVMRANGATLLTPEETKAKHERFKRVYDNLRRINDSQPPASPDVPPQLP